MEAFLVALARQMIKIHQITSRIAFGVGAGGEFWLKIPLPQKYPSLLFQRFLDGLDVFLGQGGNRGIILGLHQIGAQHGDAGAHGVDAAL